MDKEMLEGMIATLGELGEDARASLEGLQQDPENTIDVWVYMRELYALMNVLANTLAIYVTTNEAAKVLLAEDGE